MAQPSPGEMRNRFAFHNDLGLWTLDIGLRFVPRSENITVSFSPWLKHAKTSAMNAKAAAHKQNSVDRHPACLHIHPARDSQLALRTASDSVPRTWRGRKIHHPAQKRHCTTTTYVFCQAIPAYSTTPGDLCKSGKLRNAEHRSAISTEIRAEQCSALRPPPQEKNLCDTRPTPPKDKTPSCTPPPVPNS